MEKALKGDVVVIPFPFSDLSSSKNRPALVLSSLKGDDVILCQVTTQARYDAYSIELEDYDFRIGSLPCSSLIRINKLFTADRTLILRKVGTLKKEKIEKISDKVITLFR